MKDYTGTISIVDANATTTLAVTGNLEVVGGRLLGSLTGTELRGAMFIDLSVADGFPGNGAAFSLGGTLEDFYTTGQNSDYYELSSNAQAALSITGGDLISIALNTFNYIKNPLSDNLNVTVSIALSEDEVENQEGVVDGRGIPGGNLDLNKTQEARRINELGSAFDNFGYYSGTERLPEERNYYYNKRIKDSAGNPSNAAISPLTKAIGRDLGLVREKMLEIKIDPALLATGDVLDYIHSRLVISSGRIKIYRYWVGGRDASGALGWKLAKTKDGRDFDFEIEWMTCGQLADLINSVEVDGKRLYSATALTDTGWPARGLMDFDTRTLVRETRSPKERIGLRHTNIVESSLSIQGNPFLKRLQPSADDVALNGDYHIDFSLGLITIKGNSTELLRITYIVNLLEFELEWSPVEIVSLSTEAAQDGLFEQIEQSFYDTESERYINGMPTDEMFGILRRVLTAGKINQRWGE